jgi:dolichyl-diphosphooligosaccharide--protein glycosyltransferase
MNKSPHLRRIANSLYHDICSDPLTTNPNGRTDNDATTELWQLISENKYNDLLELLLKNPGLAHVRSSDGCGPMFWAYENNRKDMVHALKTMGVLDTREDAKGIIPKDLQQ